MKNKGRKIEEELFEIYYGMSSLELLDILYKENGITNESFVGVVQTKKDTEAGR